jgi:hypothetical protein
VSNGAAWDQLAYREDLGHLESRLLAIEGRPARPMPAETPVVLPPQPLDAAINELPSPPRTTASIVPELAVIAERCRRLEEAAQARATEPDATPAQAGAEIRLLTEFVTSVAAAIEMETAVEIALRAEAGPAMGVPAEVVARCQEIIAAEAAVMGQEPAAYRHALIMGRAEAQIALMANRLERLRRQRA